MLHVKMLSLSTVGKNTEADNQISITLNYLLSLRSNK